MAAGRTVIIPFFPLRDDAMKQIIGLKLGKVERRLMEMHRTLLTYGDEMIDEIAQRCTEVESGARNVDNILTNTLLPEISRLLLESIVRGSKPGAIRVSVGDDGQFVYQTETLDGAAASATASATA